jgi:steroid delta-isomerase-like uncharacterized protein
MITPSRRSTPTANAGGAAAAASVASSSAAAAAARVIGRSILASFRGGAMNRSDLQRMTEQYIAAMNRHDPVALAALYAPACHVDSPLFATLHGRDAVEASYRQWFTIFPDIEFKPESTVLDPPTAAVTTINTATHAGELLGLPPTRKKIEFRSVRLVTVDDGLIVKERRIYDFTGLLVQLGVLRARPAKA